MIKREFTTIEFRMIRSALRYFLNHANETMLPETARESIDKLIWTKFNEEK